MDIELKKRCDKLYFQYVELTREFSKVDAKLKKMKPQYDELVSEYENLRALKEGCDESRRANRQEIKNLRQRLDKYEDVEEVDIETLPERVRKIRIGSTSVRPIPKRSLETLPTWQEFITMHRGRGLSMADMGKKYQKLKKQFEK